MKTAQNPLRSKANNAVLLNSRRAVREEEILPWALSKQFGDGCFNMFCV